MVVVGGISIARIMISGGRGIIISVIIATRVVISISIRSGIVTGIRRLFGLFSRNYIILFMNKGYSISIRGGIIAEIFNANLFKIFKSDSAVFVVI